MPSEWISVKNRLPEKGQKRVCRYVFNHREDQEEIPFLSGAILLCDGGQAAFSRRG